MEVGPQNNPSFGTDSQDSDDVQVPRKTKTMSSPSPRDVKSTPATSKGVEIAKKRLRAFSIQKKSSLSPVTVPKPISTGSATVFIGKLAGAKLSQPKPEPDPAQELPKKPPKPPKPGARHIQENYVDFQKKTLEEIEDMKRKMELVELGIPLGLICPTPENDKAMPTKAMPPIKSFIAPAKVDELIREAKKAKAEGREFKFDYHKLLPDYDNPFQRKKDEPILPPPLELKEDTEIKIKDKDKRRSDKYESRRHSHRDEKRYKDDKYKDRDDKYSNYRDKSKGKSKYSEPRSKDRESEKSRDREHRRKESPKPKRGKSLEREGKKSSEKNDQENDVDLKDYLVCDSWSDHDEKSKDSTSENDEKKATGKVTEIKLTPEVNPSEVQEQAKVELKEEVKEVPDSPKPKMERLKPVIDAFKFEIEDDNEDNDDSLDIFDEDLAMENFAKVGKTKASYESPLRLFDDTKDDTDLADDTFLESVINEIKQEEIDDCSQDKGLVEYDESPKDELRGSVTPEMNDRAREIYSSRSNYSEGYKSVDSGCKSTESGYKSVESKLSEDLSDTKLPKHTVHSLETWSFVLKICQPLLFRHDNNKCFKETRVCPNIWYAENPKLCNCVKDREIVYEELEMCKMDIVDSIYGSEQAVEWSSPTGRGWYPPAARCLARSSTLPLSSEWEADDSQHDARSDMSLNQEYQRFMQAVWPEVAERTDTPGTTPVRREQKKKKMEEDVKDDRKHKKMKLSSEGWSQESEIEEEPDKSTSKKLKTEKQRRKRKHSTSVTDGSESDAKRRKKIHKKKGTKKSKSKSSQDLLKRRKQIKKNIRKLKNKEKKKKKLIKMEDDSDNQDVEKAKKKKDKKSKKKKQLKEKKKNQKKKKSRARSSSSSSSSTSSDSESEQERTKKKKAKKKKRKQSPDSNEEELFDVNILNNIKTERLTDEEKKDISFSPRRKPREIINVKELQNDFVGIQIKKEVEERMEEEKRQEEKIEALDTSQQEDSQDRKTDEKPQEFVVKELDAETTPQLRPEESNQSQCSSQESVYSLKDQAPYEKDESHLRPSSQNSNYNFHDVMASNKTHESEHGYYKSQEKEQGRYEVESKQSYYETHESAQCDNKSNEKATEHGHYATREAEQSRYEGSVNKQSHYDTHDSKLSNYDTYDSKQGHYDNHDSKQGHYDASDSKQGHYEIHDSKQSNYDTHDSKQGHYDTHDSKQGHYATHDSKHVHYDTHDSKQGHYVTHDSKQGHYDTHDSKQGHYDTHDSKQGHYDTHDSKQSHYDSNESQQNQYKGQKGVESEASHGSHELSHPTGDHEMPRDLDMENQDYGHGDYEMYEQMAMAYQSDVATQSAWSVGDRSPGLRRIETVVRGRALGEIKCDWRAGDTPVEKPHRPTRWGLKPGEVNIVLTDGEYTEPVYRIQSLANRTDNTNISYDEAYMDTYGASDRLQYGDCFSTEAAQPPGPKPRGPDVPGPGSAADPRRTSRHTTSLDDRIDLALRTTVLGEVAGNTASDTPDKGILVAKSLSSGGRSSKRVSFADGYKPGQDSDTEEPPVRKKKKGRRVGCPWPCPASHPDHVPLWDALPPPPPPASPPPPPCAPPPTHLLRAARPPALLQPPPHLMQKLDASGMPAFMPPEPPPGLISF